MIKQEWVDKIMADGTDTGPDVIGADTQELDKRDVWALRYIARMIERGVPLHVAVADYAAATDSHDYTEDPADAADEGLTYWSDDGDHA